jgi:putative ABC transport system permease protein
MIRNYLKIACRNLLRNKVYSFINIGGLAIGVSVCLLMFLYVKHELAYDSFYENASRIVRITSELKTPEAPMSIALSPVLLAPALEQDYPEIKRVARFQPTAATVKFKDKLFNEGDVYYADQAVFDVFSYQFIKGNPAKALIEPNTVVITESFAKKYAGDMELLGESIQINKAFYRVTGIIQDLPSNTDLKINALLFYDFSKTTSWIDDLSVFTFALFKGKPDLELFEQKLNQLSQQYIQPEFKKMGEDGYSLVFQTEMLTNVHYSMGKLEDTPKGNKQYGYLFLFLAFFVLIIALLNYISLLTALANERAKEVSIRKINGAKRFQLIKQFLFESLLTSAISLFFSILAFEVAIPILNQWLEIHLQISWIEVSLWSSICLVLTTLLGGFYPAFVLSSFRPIEAMKGTFVSLGKSNFRLRQFITTFQFTLTVAMLIGVFVIYKQMTFMQNHHLGFDKDQVLVLQLPSDSLAQVRGSAFANSLQEHSKIRNLTLCSGLQPDAIGATAFHVAGKRREVMTRFMFIDEQFVPLLNIKLKEGRNLSLNNVTDKKEAFIVNEAFVKMSGWEKPIGQSIEGFGYKGQVVGVVKNFNYHSLHNFIEPVAMVYNSFRSKVIMLKLNPEYLSFVKETWQSYYSDFPMEYHFLDTAFDMQYRKDLLMMTLFNAFAFLTILISCLGLFSLVIFTAERRTKEIGIRKVLGASILQITVLLSKDFLKLVLIAFVIASPIAYYFMDKWLADFAYRIEINWWIFAVAGSSAILIALLTVSWQSIKAAVANPVKSLRSE